MLIVLQFYITNGCRNLNSKLNLYSSNSKMCTHYADSHSYRMLFSEFDELYCFYSEL